MRHYSQDYLLASCFKVFDHKLVRFFTPSSMIDVGIELKEKDEINAAIAQNKHWSMEHDVYSAAIWRICNYIINNLDGVQSDDIFKEYSSSKINIKRIDFYNVSITLHIANNNFAETRRIDLDTYDAWFMSKLIQFTMNVLSRRMLNEKNI